VFWGLGWLIRVILAAEHPYWNRGAVEVYLFVWVWVDGLPVDLRSADDRFWAE